MEEILGQVIERIAKERKLNARTLGEKINKTKQGTANIFKRDIIDSDLLLILSDVLDYDFVAHLYKKRPLIKFKLKENAEWQAKIDAVNEKVKELEKTINLKNQIIKGLEKVTLHQDETIKLLKEKEKFLTTKK